MDNIINTKILNTSFKRILFVLITIGIVVGLSNGGIKTVPYAVFLSVVLGYLCFPITAIFIQPVWDWMFMVNHSVMDQLSTERKERESVKQLLQEALELAEQQGSTNVAEKIKKVMSAHYSYRNPSR